jgi:hypothetical protein
MDLNEIRRGDVSGDNDVADALKVLAEHVADLESRLMIAESDISDLEA